VITDFIDLEGFLCVGLQTNVHKIADIAGARIPSEEFAKCLLKDDEALGPLFPDQPLHTDMVYKDTEESRTFASIVGTREDDVFRYPMGGVTWVQNSTGRMQSDDTYPDLFAHLRCNLILARLEITKLRTGIVHNKI